MVRIEAGEIVKDNFPTTGDQKLRCIIALCWGCFGNIIMSIKARVGTLYVIGSIINSFKAALYGKLCIKLDLKLYCLCLNQTYSSDIVFQSVAVEARPESVV